MHQGCRIGEAELDDEAVGAILNVLEGSGQADARAVAVVRAAV